MNERHLERVFRQIVLSVASLPFALGTAACGGSTEGDADDTNAGGSENQGSGGSGSSGGSASGGAAGNGSGGIASGGYGAIGGSGATAGVAGAAGAGATAGSGGQTGCMGPPKDCFSTSQIVLPLSCVTDPAVPPTPEQCAQFCVSNFGGATYGSCTISAYDAETVTILCYATCAVGRRPANFGHAAGDCSSPGDYFAEVARLEAASVHVFRHLRRELASHRAPRGLLRRLSAAARDEVRHARRTSAIARRFGGKPQAPRVQRPAKRTFAAMALENMVEGCVRETFGALIAHHQAARARDPELRTTLARIARDETRHAALSWAIQQWLEPRLNRVERAQVRRARSEAAQELWRELEQPAPRDERKVLGFAEPHEARGLLAALRRELWSAR